jgi:hypothetical protein
MFLVLDAACVETARSFATGWELQIAPGEIVCGTAGGAAFLARVVGLGCRTDPAALAV